MSDFDISENLKKYSAIETCPVRNIIARFSGKWSILILCVLSENETTRFNALGRIIPDISPKVLAATLKTLEADRLIKRELYPEVPPRVEYSLTDKGRSLMPIINSLIKWAVDNREG